MRVSVALSRTAKAASTAGAVSMLTVGSFTLLRIFDGGADAAVPVRTPVDTFDARRDDATDAAGVRVRVVQTQRQQHAARTTTQSVVEPTTANAGKSGGVEAAQAVPQTLVQWPQEDIVAALAECQQLKASVSVDWQPIAPMRNDACGTPAPISLRAVGTKSVALKPNAITNCRVAAALARWIDDDVQTAAKTHLGTAVVSVSVADAYQCRNRNGAVQAPLSEHALANAIDIASFELADGRIVKVASDWGQTARDVAAKLVKTAPSKVAEAAPAKAPPAAAPATKEKANAADKHGRMTLGASSPVQSDSTAAPSQNSLFLRDIHASACRKFGTVLGPEANEYHRDHFHLDAKVRRGKAFCE